MSIIINLRNLIQDKGYTISKLADEINITPANLSKIVNNKISEIKLETLSKICEILKCNPGDIIEFKSEIKPKIIPFFLDCVGGTDSILSGGIENIKKFFQLIIQFQKEKNLEFRIFIMTDIALESAKSKFILLNDLAENFGLPNLFYGAVMEHGGFLITKEKITQFNTIDTRILEKMVDIESIISDYNAQINKNVISFCNIIFDRKIKRSELAKISEKIEKKINCSDIEVITFYDPYGIEIDIKNKENCKANAVQKIVDNLRNEFDIPLAVMGGAPLKVNWEMYTKSYNKLSQINCKVIEIISKNLKEIVEIEEIDYNDSNVIALDLSDFNEIIKLFAIIRSSIK